MYNFGSESFSSLAPKIWELVPDTIEMKNYYQASKAKLKLGPRVNV